MSHAVRVATIAALMALLLLAAWFRLSSLGVLPIHLADESYYGIQAWRLAHGQEFRLHTTSGNLVDPFLLLLQAPLHWLAEPCVGLLRLPVALSGLLAVAVVFAAVDRAWDRRAAVWASVLLATLPMSIAFSRIGCEFGQTPLLGALAALFALKGRGWAFLLSVVAALLVHPTNVLLLPILGPGYLIATSRRWADDPIARRRAWRRIAVVAACLVAVQTVLLWRRPIVQSRLNGLMGRLGELDWPTYLGLFARKLLGGIAPLFDTADHPRLWAVGAISFLVVGSWFLARRRQWDRLSIVAGTLAGLAALHVLGGSRLFEGEDRYAAVLLAPLSMSVAALAASIGPLAGPSRWGFGHWPALAAGGLLLWATHAQYVRPLIAVIPGESFWTFQNDSVDPFAQLLQAARDEARSRPASPPPLLVAEHYFVSQPLEYLASGGSGPRVVELITLAELGELVGNGDPLPRNAAQMVDRLRAGDLVAAGPPILPALQGWVENTSRDAFPGDGLRQWRPACIAAGVALYSANPSRIALDTSQDDSERR